MSEEHEGPLRHRWQAMFTAPELIEECRKRRDNHKTHAEYWDREFRELNEELERSTTVETQKVTGGEQRVLRYDQGLHAKAQNAETRAASHRARAAEYQRWVILLEKKRDGGTLPLRFDDVTFFFQPLEEVPSG
jgi:hypothetical protein